MADTRHENKSSQKNEESFRQAGEQVTEQTRRMGSVTSKAGEDMSQASADLLRQNTEMLQNAWQFAMESATAIMNRSTDQLGRSFGWTGDEAQQAAQKSARNTQTVIDSATVVTKGMNDIAREWLQLARRQMEYNLDHMNELWHCRSPHEFAAFQSELIRDAMTKAIESGRRVADMSLKVADDAGKRIASSTQRAA
jgi:phasin family protein